MCWFDCCSRTKTPPPTPHTTPIAGMAGASHASGIKRALTADKARMERDLPPAIDLPPTLHDTAGVPYHRAHAASMDSQCGAKYATALHTARAVGHERFGSIEAAIGNLPPQPAPISSSPPLATATIRVKQKADSPRGIIAGNVPV